ncbi:post-GPI attachment to proteins factor 3 [Nematocida sp. AWRm80]|nr:post-GPI attachment to proteins factor 3 [Nematocida sp. AWRm80]
MHWYTGIAEEYLGTQLDKYIWNRKDLENNSNFIRMSITTGNTIGKYNGKYAFIRVFSTQEIVSALSSLISTMIFIGYTIKIHKILRRVKENKEIRSIVYTSKWDRIYNKQKKEYLHYPNTEETKKIEKIEKKEIDKSSETKKNIIRYIDTIRYTLYAQCLTWLFSCIFHCRDTYITQCLDYFSATLSIILMIITSLCSLGVYSIKIIIFFTLLYSGHILYLLNDFDFKYNILINSILFLVLVMLYLIIQYNTTGAHRSILYLSVIGLVISAVFQIIDFGPILFLLDSHSIWHILGCLYSWILYKYYLIDIEYKYSINRRV